MIYGHHLERAYLIATANKLFKVVAYGKVDQQRSRKSNQYDFPKGFVEYSILKIP